jgi:hypothetical protein
MPVLDRPPGSAERRDQAGEQFQAPAALVIGARMPENGPARTVVVDLNAQAARPAGQADLDRARPVPQRVRDQLADDELGQAGVLAQIPPGHQQAHFPPRAGGLRRIAVEPDNHGQPARGRQRHRRPPGPGEDLPSGPVAPRSSARPNSPGGQREPRAGPSVTMRC